MASTASAAAGSTFGAVGAIMSGQAQGNALETSADINQQNSTLALETGDYDANRVQIMGDHRIGTVEAAYGANGIASDSGNVLNVLAASHANEELDRLNVLHGAQVRAINYANQASIERAGASSARTAGYINAIGSVAMGGSKIAEQKYGGKDKYGDGKTWGEGSSGGDGSGVSGEEAGQDTAGESNADMSGVV